LDCVFCCLGWGFFGVLFGVFWFFFFSSFFFFFCFLCFLVWLVCFLGVICFFFVFLWVFLFFFFVLVFFFFFFCVGSDHVHLAALRRVVPKPPLSPPAFALLSVQRLSCPIFWPPPLTLQTERRCSPDANWRSAFHFLFFCRIYCSPFGSKPSPSTTPTRPFLPRELFLGPSPVFVSTLFLQPPGPRLFFFLAPPRRVPQTVCAWALSMLKFSTVLVCVFFFFFFFDCSS